LSFAFHKNLSLEVIHSQNKICKFTEKFLFSNLTGMQKILFIFVPAISNNNKKTEFIFNDN